MGDLGTTVVSSTGGQFPYFDIGSAVTLVRICCYKEKWLQQPARERKTGIIREEQEGGNRGRILQQASDH